MAELLGIENLKKLAKVGVDFGEQLHISAKNGLNWKDSFDFIDEGIALIGVIGSIDEAKKEWVDMSEAESEELNNYIAEELDIDNEKAEKVAEKAINLGFAALDLVSAIREAKEPPITEDPGGTV